MDDDVITGDAKVLKVGVLMGGSQDLPLTLCKISVLYVFFSGHDPIPFYYNRKIREQKKLIATVASAAKRGGHLLFHAKCWRRDSFFVRPAGWLSVLSTLPNSSIYFGPEYSAGDFE